jgi:carbamate kinase
MSRSSRLVVALGGNALLRRGESAWAETQRHNVVEAASTLAALAGDYELVLTHGNGPQIGLLALEADAYKEVPAYPLDVLGAESQGMIGYLLAQALRNELRRDVVVVLTQVIVDAGDPAFERPTKPIGPVYAEQDALGLAEEHGWTVARDGRYFRRVVASPDPKTIVELESIERLISAGAVVICAGGGGIPVIVEGERLQGVEAVIDKDLSAALLAAEIGAERLIMLTDVPYVMRNWGTPNAEPITHATPDELRLTEFASGSMAPKVMAACRFVDQTGGTAAIGALADLEDVARGETGTRIAATSAAATP